MTYSEMPRRVQVLLDPVSPTLFSDQAKQIAEICRPSTSSKCNKPTQIRRFYDEMVMWHDKVFVAKTPDEQKKKLNEFLPFIQMIRAKTAYARGRGLIDDHFTAMMDSLIVQITTPERLRTAKLFFEAFMGYMKYFEKVEETK